MFEITKNKEEIIVTASLKKRNTISEKKIRILWPQALEAAKENFPEVKISNVPDNKKIATNFDQNNSVTWKFKIIESSKQKKRKNKFLEQVTEIQADTEKGLTKSEESATVEETSQSDQPAIVQEPTE